MSQCPPRRRDLSRPRPARRDLLTTPRGSPGFPRLFETLEARPLAAGTGVCYLLDSGRPPRVTQDGTDTRRCEGGLAVDSISSSNRLSALDRAILTEKQRTASILEVALRLLLEEETVRQRLRRIAKVLKDDAAAEGAAAGPAQARPASVA
jgi:hypothetical protein